METKTNTAVEVGTKIATQLSKGEDIINVEAPLFILFAEYLGYVSIFNEEAENWCDGKVPEKHVQKLIILEAKCILRQMEKDYGTEEIREFYSMYYPLILEEYADKLANLIDSND